jgi:FkbM family methyltransferase
MRRALLYNPRLLLERISQELNKRHRVHRLRGTPASWLGTHHIDSMELIDVAARNGERVFYDIGANVGSWTLLCRALVPDSEIVAFEPMAQHVDQFRHHTSGMKRIRLLPQALGAKDEVREFYPTSYSDASSFYPLNRAGETQWNIKNEAPCPMRVRRLDDIMEEEKLPWPDFIKLDVQGFELEVLRGAELALGRARWVLSEVSFKDFYEGQVLFPGLSGFLAERGFDVYALGHSIATGVELNTGDVLFRRRG